MKGWSKPKPPVEVPSFGGRDEPRLILIILLGLALAAGLLFPRRLIRTVAKLERS